MLYVFVTQMKSIKNKQKIRKFGYFFLEKNSHGSRKSLSALNIYSNINYRVLSAGTRIRYQKKENRKYKLENIIQLAFDKKNRHIFKNTQKNCM